MEDVELEDVVVFCGDDEEAVFVVWGLGLGELFEFDALLGNCELRGCGGGYVGAEFHRYGGGFELGECDAVFVGTPHAGFEDKGVDPAAEVGDGEDAAVA